MKPVSEIAIRESVAVLLTAYFQKQRAERGDSFATAEEMVAVLSDPLAWLTMVRGEDTYELFTSLLS